MVAQGSPGGVFRSPEASRKGAEVFAAASLGHRIIERLGGVNRTKLIYLNAETGREWYGGELHDAILNVACALVDLYHFRPGTGVCLAHQHSDLSCILALGVICAGGFVACVYPRDPYAELLDLARKIEPRFLFGQPTMVGWAERLAEDIALRVEFVSMGDEATGANFRHLLEYNHLGSASRGRVPVACRDKTQHLAIITMSSGTTGRPKAIPVTHHNCLADLAPLTDRKYPPGFRLLSAAPLDYVSGRLTAFMGLETGVTTVITGSGLEPLYLLSLIESQRISCLFVGAHSFYSLISHPKRDHFDLSSLLVVFPMGAKVVYQREFRSFLGRWPNVRAVRTGYGSSEMSGVALNTRTPEEYLRDSDNCGHLLAGVSAKIVNPARPDELLAENQTGLLLVQTESHFPGYYDIQRAKKGAGAGSPFHGGESVFDEQGFYITGDLAYFNQRQQLYIVGRNSELMHCRAAKKVLPSELEEVLAGHPWVDKACVLGVQHERDPTTQCPRAYVVAKRELYLAAGPSLYNERIRTGHASHMKTIIAALDANENETQLAADDEEPTLKFTGHNKLCRLADDGLRRELLQDLMNYVNERVAWEKQLTGGICLIDELPTLRATGKMDKRYLRSLALDQIELFGDRSDN